MIFIWIFFQIYVILINKRMEQLNNDLSYDLFWLDKKNKNTLVTRSHYGFFLLI